MGDASESFEYIGCYHNLPRVPGFTNWNPNNLINNPQRKEICADRALNANSQFYGLENNNGCLVFDQNDMNNMEKNNLKTPEQLCTNAFQVAAYKKSDPEIVVEKEAARAPPAPSVLYKCNNYTCQQDPNGNYSSLAECNNDCKPSFVCNRPDDGFPSCEETQTLANQLKSAQDQFNDAKSRMQKIKRPYSKVDWCFLGGTVPTKNDYGWKEQAGQKVQSLDYYQTKCDNTPGCTGFNWRGDGAPSWYYTGDNFTVATNGGGWPGPGCQPGATGVPYNEKCCHGFSIQKADDSSERDAAQKKLSLYQNTIDSINNKVKQGDSNNYFDSLKSCQSSCKPKFNCDMDTLTVFPAADGSYNSIEEAENNCKPRFSCDTENWVVRMDPRGKYKDINLASMNCQPPLIVPKTKITQKDLEKENNIKANVEGQLKSDTLRLESDYLHMLVWGALAILFIYMVFYYSTNNTNSVLQNLIIIVVLIALIWTISVALWNYFKNNPIKFTEGPIMY